MFPTRVGMNRHTCSSDVAAQNVPHTCGDEPEIKMKFRDDMICSPHVWG